MWILALLSSTAWAQSGLDVTGRVSMRVHNFSYDESSQIKPDSIPDDQYSKTTAIPGLQQALNLAIFGRTQDLDMTLLADLSNNSWNRLEVRNLNRLSRLTFNLRFAQHEVILGDFFESLGETFLQSREIRGARYAFVGEDLFGAGSFADFRMLGGIVQRAVSIGDNLINLYRQYETAGQYRRWLGGGILNAGQRGAFDFSIKYLWGKDQESSIDSSINDPFSNQVLGGNLDFYFWDRNIRLFGEYLLSQKDTVALGRVKDKAYKGGFDFRYETFKLAVMYYHFGYNYFTIGYPFLENDRKGIEGQLTYAVPKVISFITKFEIYSNNLDHLVTMPTTDTKIFDLGATTVNPDWPELSVSVGLRKDKSDQIFDPDDNPLQTDKFTRKLEGRVGFTARDTRMSLSAIYLDLDDQSLVPSGTPLGTEQLIGSCNIYAALSPVSFISGGAVFSRLTMTNGQKNDNVYLYESNRWDILPGKLKLETTLSYALNDAADGGTQDLLNNYWQLNGEISLEYFFTNEVSFKAIVGTDTRRFKYTDEQALEIIADPEYGPEYFNGNESYSGLIAGGELNWIF